MIEIETIILEDNIEYEIISKEILNNITYYFLSNNNKYVVRKQIGNELIGLDNEEEFNDVINNFISKGQKNE